MAIATFDRDAARSGAGSEPRFKLVEELFRTGDAVFWRAEDRRSQRRATVRVIDVGREDGTRRLGDLHRERTLADRLGHPEVLRTDVPLIEGERIYQLVEPEPVSSLDSMGNVGRLSLLTLLVGAARVLADAHARGVFHGAFTRASCLRTVDGRLIVQGFTGDAPAAAVVRDGIAADHHAFLLFADEMLRGSGGPPPRLRRYFHRELAPGAARPAPNALASLADELRESLEDTFPWPASEVPTTSAVPQVAQGLLEVRKGAPRAQLAHETSIVTPPAALARPGTAPVPAAGRPAVLASSPLPSRSAPKVEPQAAPKAAPAPGASPKRALQAVSPPAATAAPTSSGAGVHTAAKAAAARPGAASQPVAPTLPDTPVPAPAATASVPRASTDVWYPPVSPQAASPTQVDAPTARRSLRPWIALAVLIAVLAAVWQFGGKRGADAGTRATAPEAPVEGDQDASPGNGGPTTTAEGEAASSLKPASSAISAGADAPAVATNGAPTPPVSRTEAVGVDAPAAMVPRPSALPAAAPRTATSDALRATAARAAAPERRAPLAAGGAAEDAQARRSRVATLVAGGVRALNALEPGAAAEAFAAALAIAPDDAAARDGSQRARRLAGVAALMQDARDASQRGDHARAVQGYAQALSNDPRNRGLAEALANARRNLASDATGNLLAEGHAALGSGRLEAAQAAFERALEINPRAPGARAGILQATTAIALRDAAATRRPSSIDAVP